MNKNDSKKIEKISNYLEQLDLAGYFMVADLKNSDRGAAFCNFSHDQCVMMLQKLFESLPPEVVKDFMYIAKNDNIGGLTDTEKKTVLSKEEANWFEKNKDLPFFDGDDPFSQNVFNKARKYQKVKIISYPRSSADKAVAEFEGIINDFIKDKKVIDIKYQVNVFKNDISSRFDDYAQSAMIIYEERHDKLSLVENLKLEKDELDGKIIRLRTFLHNDEKLEKIGTGQTQMLQLQLEAMERYNEILNSRILYMISGGEKK